MSGRHANIAVFVPHNGCPHTCSFCNQRTISGRQQQPTPQDVADTLERFAVQRRHSDYDCAELAFFGGSFTAIGRSYMLSLLEAVQPFLASGVISGIRCSTRPDCIDGEVLRLLKRLGVTAIELGAQSMDDRVLALNERGHTAEQVRAASRLIAASGFELGLQMMTGLYGDTPDGSFETAKQLAALRPATVRVYPTVVLGGTGLASLVRSGEYVPQTLEEAVALCSRLLEYFSEQDIRVIRLGLHASRDIERDYIAGGYHPALRELCEGRIFLRRMAALLGLSDRLEAALSGNPCPVMPERKAVFAVNPGDISKATGQKACNKTILREMGIDIKIIGDGGMAKGEIALLPLE